LLALT
jgi:hypothetical protein